MSIILMTDSAADYTQKELSEKNIVCVPLNVHIKDETYQAGVTIDPDTFYNKIAEEKCFAKTSQPSPEAFIQHFQAAKDNSDTVIYIAISSVLSGTMQCAQIAKEMVGYENIHIIDSLLVSPAQRLLVDYAKELIDSGLPIDEIIKKVEDHRYRVTAFAVVDTLEYLHKGGRLTYAEAAIGEFMKIKPLVIITAKDAFKAFGKTMGMSRAYKALLKKIETMPPDETKPIIMLYSKDPTNCMEFKERLSNEHPEYKIEDFYVNLGCTVGVHTGPGVVGLAYTLKEDLK